MGILVFAVIISIVAVIVSIAMTIKFFQATEDIKKIRESVCVEAEAQEMLIEKKVPTKKEVIIFIIAILVILIL